MTLMLAGLDAMSCLLGGDLAGYSGTASGTTTTTTLTATGTPWVASTYIGHIVVTTAAAPAYGVITANTTSVLTVDRWYQLGLPGGTVATLPTNTTTFAILPGNAPYWYMALNNGTHVVSTADTTLTGEITTSGGGLIRALAAYAHTTNATTYTLTNTFVANVTDSLPAIVNNIGVFNTLTPATGRMIFQTALTPSTATLSASGDQITVTSTVTV